MFLLGKLKFYLAAALTAVAAFFGIYWMGTQRGSEKAKRKEAERALKAAKTEREKRDEINKLSPDERRRRLDGWMSDDEDL